MERWVGYSADNSYQWWTSGLAHGATEVPRMVGGGMIFPEMDWRSARVGSPAIRPSVLLRVPVSPANPRHGQQLGSRFPPMEWVSDQVPGRTEPPRSPSFPFPLPVLSFGEVGPPHLVCSRIGTWCLGARKKQLGELSRDRGVF
jgi:hypothetical protein